MPVVWQALYGNLYLAEGLTKREAIENAWQKAPDQLKSRFKRMEEFEKVLCFVWHHYERGNNRYVWLTWG